MAIDFKDYYATLGVEREASANEVKQAFRKLARKYHPDVAKDKKTAEAKFKEINEAHEVLSDPLKRQKYDELWARWQEHGPDAPSSGGIGRAARRSGAHEFHFHGTGFSDFFEQFFGGASGRDFAGGRDFDVGGGPAAAGPRRGRDIEGDILVTLAEAMHGTTRPISLQSVDTRTGAAESRSFTVRIPPGAAEGKRIRIPGKGEPGASGGAPGDLFLRVRYAAHPDFRARETDLYYDLNLAPWEAVLGARVVVPSFDGPIKVRIPPGTNHGRQLRVRGYGLPKGGTGERGDLHIIVNIEVPTSVSEGERVLWEKLAQTSRFSPRPPA